MNIKIFDSNKIKVDEKSYKYILIYHIGYVTVKDLFSYAKLILFYLIMDKINSYIERKQWK